MKVLLCSTYELGHQPLALAQPAAQLLASGFEVQCRDLAVQSLERAVVEWADVVGISIPMFTAIRLGVKLGDQIKAVNPRAHVTYFGLYASLNAQYLFEKGDWEKVKCMELLFVRGAANKDVSTALDISEQQVANFKFDFLDRLRKLVKQQRLNEDVFPELYQDER